MTTQIKTAKVTTVKLGNLEIEGLLIEDGSFGVAQQQVASLFSVIPTTAPKWLKARLDNGFQLFQVKTDRPKQDGKQNRAENVLTLTQFETLLRKLDREGNETARLMVDSMIGLSLTQLFSDAFNIKFDKEDRQEWLKARAKGKVTRRRLTDAIKEWCESNNCPEKLQPYIIYCSDQINQKVFGKKAKELREEHGVKTNDLLRDKFTDDELTLIDRIEDRTMLTMDMLGIKPTDALVKIIERL